MTGPHRTSDAPAIAIASLYQEFLITRQTGRAVRDGIERMIGSGDRESLAVLDLQDVAVIDFSCADEVVAKLVLGPENGTLRTTERYVLVRGVREHHLDPVEGALRHRGLAVSALRETGEPMLLGEIDPEAGAIWNALCRCGRVRGEALARQLGLDGEACERILEGLHVRRLVRRCGDAWESLTFTVSSRRDPGPEERSGGASGPGAG